jgi:hypothetical protein
MPKPKPPVDLPSSLPNPEDPEDRLIPAFETAIGGSSGSSRMEKPIYVSEKALTAHNEAIKKEAKEMVKHAPQANHIASLFAKKAVRPDEVAALRRQMFETVKRRMADVDQVLEGTKKWDGAQVRLFALLTERVMPKLSSLTIEDDTQRKLEDMSVEELEAIALGKKKATAIDAVMTNAEQEDKQEVEKEERAVSEYARKRSTRALANVEVMDRLSKEWYEKMKKTRGKGKNGKLTTLERQVIEGRISPAEAAEKERIRREKLRSHFVKQHEIDVRRRSLTLGDPVSAKIAKQLVNEVNGHMDPFRVHPAKGRRTRGGLESRRIASEKFMKERMEIESKTNVFLRHAVPKEHEHLLSESGMIPMDQARKIKPEWFAPPDPKLREKYAKQKNDLFRSESLK